MKAYNYFKILFLSLTCVKTAKAQVPFTDYLCSSDTLFNSAKRFSNTVNSTTIINSLKTSNFADGQLNGEISGIGFNRSSTFTNYEGKGKLKSFESGFLYSLHNFSSGSQLTAINKNSVSLSIIGQPALSGTETVPYSSNIVPIPTRLQKMITGESSFSSSNSRGNLFVTTKFYRNNNDLYIVNKDTFSSANDKGVITPQFEGLKTNFKTLLSKLSSAEYEGWILELDRINNNVQYRRFDLGRSPRSAFKIVSERISDATTSKITETYQVLGDDGFNILIKTVENNKVHEFYVYSEEETAQENHWTRINPEVSGKVESLGKNYLIDLYSSIIKDSTLQYTVFLNVKDLHYNRANQNIILTSQGGTEDFDQFINSYGLKTTETSGPVLASNLKEFLSSGLVSDPYGSIIEIKGSDDLALITKCNFDFGRGRKFTNPVSINLYNVQYEDENSIPQDAQFLVFSESVFSNQQGQNPSHKTGVNNFQNEIYLANLTGVDFDGVSVDFTKLDYRLVGVETSGASISIAKYSEAYLPLIVLGNSPNLTTDSISVLKGFAEQFINPIKCEEANTIIEIEEQMVEVIAFPNPISKDGINGKLLKINTKDNLNLYDFSGKLILREHDSNCMDISKCDVGLYILKGDLGWSKKVVIID